MSDRQISIPSKLRIKRKLETRLAATIATQKRSLGYKTSRLPTRSEAIDGDKDYVSMALSEMLENHNLDFKALNNRQRELIQVFVDEMINRSKQRLEIKTLAARENGLDFILDSQAKLEDMNQKIRLLEIELYEQLEEVTKERDNGLLTTSEYLMRKEEIIQNIYVLKQIYLEDGLKITNSKLLSDAVKIQIANISHGNQDKSFVDQASAPEVYKPTDVEIDDLI